MFVKQLVKTALFRAKDFNPFVGKCSLYLPIYDSRTGGPASFMKNLAKGLEQAGCSLTRNRFSRYESILFPIQYDLEALKILKNRGVRLIQRLDGLYYPPYFSEELVQLNQQPKSIYKELADVVIFQSEYSKKQCYEIMGAPKSNKEIIILNGADPEFFYPVAKELGRQVWRFVSTGNFRTKDMLEPTIKALDILWKERQDFEYVVVGPVAKNIADYLERPYVQSISALPLEELGDILRTAHVFFWSFLNPNCPNSVIEAISCGLPVVSFCSGSLPELCFFQKDLLARVSADVLQSYEDFSAEALLEKLKQCMSDYVSYRRKAIEHCEDFSIEIMTARYAESLLV